MIRKKIEELFGIDLRSLAAFRIGLALVVLGDALSRSFDLVSFHSDLGFTPRHLILKYYPSLWSISAHMMSGSPVFQAALFGLAILLAFLLLIGWRTRLVTCFSWFLLMSMQVRNPMVLHSGDYWLRLQLFWAMFLPLGAGYSVDHLFKTGREKGPRTLLSMGTLALLGQAVLVYVFSAYTKWMNLSWQEGRAVYQALQTGQYVTPWGDALVHLPFGVMKLLSYAVLLYETLGPVLLFTPVYTGPVRTLAVFGFFLLQSGFGVCMVLGNFPWVSAVAMLPFIPAWAWEHFPVRFRIPDGEKIKKRVREMTGWMNSLRASRLPSRAGDAAVLFFFACAVLINVQSVARVRILPPWLDWVQQGLYLDQTWTMFSPPDESSAWFVVEGERRDGTRIDLLQKGAPVRRGAPSSDSKFYRNITWYKFLSHLWTPSYKDYLPYYAWYLCQKWNRGVGESQEIKRLTIYSVWQRFYPKKDRIKRTPLWTHYCFKKDLPPNLV